MVGIEAYNEVAVDASRNLTVSVIIVQHGKLIFDLDGRHSFESRNT